jgi:hypothetical protein
MAQYGGGGCWLQRGGRGKENTQKSRKKYIENNGVFTEFNIWPYITLELIG